MPKIEPFEKYSDEYDEWFRNNADLYESELETIRQLMPPSGAEGIEVGVGSGKFAAPLGIKIGVEPSKKMAIKARQLGIEVYHGIAEDLPFSDNRFDYVLMVTTICFVDDITRALKEAFRVLKPGGIIILGFVDRESELGRRYMEKREHSKFYKDATFFSTREVLKLLEGTGFKLEQVKQTIISGMPPKTILNGFGKGSFVAIKAIKQLKLINRYT
ncbi:MAG TPA: methyltransferase domain-containing protein [Syntrophales bacterium]|nr:methyltransferase domain-containing protein [Syntrophales bacterium]HOL58825.1 methyltransferase domain-containing protein [Syntrophales bacterium]HPO35152.1 methyltransferase domain-containing protein [Syntrophales bacterium]